MTTADEPSDGPPNPGDLLIRLGHDGHYWYRIVDGTESDVPPAGWTLGGRLDEEARAHYLPRPVDRLATGSD